MAQRPHVPKFGNWESEENVPYTVYFDKARKGKTGGKIINPNDPQENPDMFPTAAPSRRPVPEEPAGRGSVKPAHDPRVSREDGGLRQFTESPARNDNSARKTDSSSTHHRHGGRGSGSGRPTRQSAGSEYSIERSPLHPQYQARAAGRGSGSPAPEGKNSYDSSHGTPGRSRLRPARSESPDRGAAVPKFGDWDEKNPQSAETYTDIFNRVREERHTDGSANVPGMDSKSPYNNIRKGKSDERQRSTRCCFL